MDPRKAIWRVYFDAVMLSMYFCIRVSSPKVYRLPCHRIRQLLNM